MWFIRLGKKIINYKYVPIKIIMCGFRASHLIIMSSCAGNSRAVCNLQPPEDIFSFGKIVIWFDREFGEGDRT